MEKLYYEIPYVQSFEAKVISCVTGGDGTYLVTLDRTGFYPEGGGQPGDTGKLGEAKVLDTREKDGEVIHVTDRPLVPGDMAAGAVDWERRYGNMQNHSGEHLFSGLVHRIYGFDNVGFHMGKDGMTVDFNGVLTMEQAEALETIANEKIYENLPVIQTFPSGEELDQLEYRSKKELTGQVRIIEVPGCDVCACCGTHVMRTGEIGILKVTGLIHYKGGVRISLLCGMSALKDYRKKQGQINEISVLLSAKPELVAEAAARLKEESGQKDGRINQLFLELCGAKMMTYEADTAPLAVFEDGLSPIQIRQFCTMLYENGKGETVLVCSGQEGGYQYAAGSQNRDMRTLSKRMNEALRGRGGGSAQMAQGTFFAGKDEILQVFHNMA